MMMMMMMMMMLWFAPYPCLLNMGTICECGSLLFQVTIIRNRAQEQQMNKIRLPRHANGQRVCQSPKCLLTRIHWNQHRAWPILSVSLN
ncbi:hypothetical protein AHF37_04959 [Paragonimus kellicotti]|nr:hypothetical protein AHF37_04959 [Paragonimus kellicotti]